MNKLWVKHFVLSFLNALVYASKLIDYCKQNLLIAQNIFTSYYLFCIKTQHYGYFIKKEKQSGPLKSAYVFCY